MEEIKADFLGNFSIEDAAKFDDAKLEDTFSGIKERKKYSMKQLQDYVKSTEYLDSVKDKLKNK
jgi:hypothetical protein